MVRTRSSRNREGSAEVEQLPVSTKVSTRRRGRKQIATETVVDAERTPESAAQEAAWPSHVHPNLSQEPRGSGIAMAPDHITANVSLDGNSEQAAAVPDAVQHSPTKVSGEIDFSGEAAQIAEAILNSREDEQQISGSTAPTGEQHQGNSEFAPAHPEVDSLPVPDDARRDQTVGRPAQTELQEERGIPSSSAKEMSASAAPGEALDDTPPDQQGKASSDYRETSGNPELVGTTCLAISEGVEPVKVQPAANARPHIGHDSANNSINDDLATGRPEAVARDATSTLLHKRTSMRSGSLEAYERGAAPASFR